MAPKAQQVEFLLSQVRNSTGSLASGTVTFYAAGTTTLKTIWTDRDQATPAANPYTLDANGTAQIYASGLYKVLIKNAAGTTIYTRDNLYFEFSPSDDIDALQYSPYTFTQATIAAALTAIGTVNKVTLLLRPGTWVISSNADWSAYTNVTFKIVPGAVLSGAFTVSIPNIEAGLYQIFDSTLGVVTFGNGTAIQKVLPQWWGAKGNDSTDDTAALNAAFATGKPVFLPFGSYRTTGLTVNVPLFSLEGDVGSAGTHGQGSRIVMTGTTGTALAFGASAGRFHIRNLTLAKLTDAANTMTGIGFTSTVAMYDSVLENVYLDYFKFGILLINGYHNKISNVRIAGPSPLIAGSEGIKLGEDATDSVTTTILDHVYVSRYAIGIHNKYAENTTMIQPLVELSTVGIKNTANGNGTIISPYFASNVTSDIDSGGKLNISTNRDLVIAPVISIAQAYAQRPNTQAGIVLFRSGSNQTITKASATNIQFNADNGGGITDAYGWYDTGTYVYTAPYSGLYIVHLQVQIASLVADKDWYISIYGNGATRATAQANSVTSAMNQTLSATAVFWMDAGDNDLAGKVYHNDTVDRDIVLGEALTFMAVKML